MADQIEEPKTVVYKIDTAVTTIEEVISLILTTVAPDSWRRVGGVGALGSVKRKADDFTNLIVFQTPAVQTDIGSLLKALRVQAP